MPGIPAPASLRTRAYQTFSVDLGAYGGIGANCPTFTVSLLIGNTDHGATPRLKECLTMLTDAELDALLKRANRDAELSDPASFFCAHARQAMGIFNYLIRLSEMADNAAQAYWSSVSGDCPPEKKGLYKQYLQGNSYALVEMPLCRLVDGFLSYLSEAVRIVLQTRPEILKSSATVRLDYVLRFKNLDELVHDLVDKKVMELGYGGFHDLSDWCQKRLGEAIVQDEQQLQQVVELIETRNLIVHNRSRIGAKYLDRIPTCGLKLGDHRKLTAEYLFCAYGLLVDVAKSYDARIGAKFGLAARKQDSQGEAVGSD